MQTARSAILVRGAREHNLKNVDLRLPHGALIVLTGVSGSGKSSLAFDTLFAEGQRRYIESLSTYARQFIGQLPKPNVDSISGLPPSISIQQKTAGRNPRSTVGTMTELYDYLRVLYARVGQGFCPQCGRPISAQSPEQIVDSLALLPTGTQFAILAPVVQQQKGEFRELFRSLLRQGFLRARVNGQYVKLTDQIELDRRLRHTIELVVDRLVAGKDSRHRLAEAVETALRLSGGSLIVVPMADAPTETESHAAVSEQETAGSTAKAHKNATDRIQPAQTSQDVLFSTLPAERLYSVHYACTQCGLSFEPPSPQLFSFNSPRGMCPECQGLGQRYEFDLEKLTADPGKSLWDGALHLIGPIKKLPRTRRRLLVSAAETIERWLKLPRRTILEWPWKDVPEEAKRLFLYGTGERQITLRFGTRSGRYAIPVSYSGLLPPLLQQYQKVRSGPRRRQLEKYLRYSRCAACDGTRLNPQARNVRVTTASQRFAERGHPRSLSLPEVCRLTIAEASEFFEALQLDQTGQRIAAEPLKEIRGRLHFLLKCGLGYLTLERSAPTLSGGESQRIRLAGQIGAGLAGVLYVLDEPSIGLHPRDNRRLLDSLCQLRDQGNTVVVVEHDEETIRSADYVVDFGPGPGVQGGQVVVAGRPSKVERSRKSLTGQYLSGRRRIDVPKRRRPVGDKWLVVKGARHNNLKNIDVRIPLNAFVCVTGVSGSGKSSLVNDILWQVLNRELNKGKGEPGEHDEVLGLEHLDKAIDIDQSLIGRTPRSNPATYVKLFDEIRKLYAQLPQSRMRGYQPGRFSFNVPGGRCEACEGHGANKLEMDFLADIWVTCPVCNGRRFSRETLEVRFAGKNIADVLDMDVQQAMEHFRNFPKITRLLKALHDVGLDYMKLGQPSPTLSGGEAQRVKLARELGKRSTGRTIYLLDEPTTGLHFADVEKLLQVLHGLVDAGNTVLVIEHHLDVIKTADWVIDLGPEGGDEGGWVVVAGTPEDVARCDRSHTGRALRSVLPGFEPDPTFGLHVGGHKPPEGDGFTSSAAAAAADDSRSDGRPTNIASSRNSNARQTDVNAAVAGSNGRRRRSKSDVIRVFGAAQHNLQHIDVQIPRNRISVFCGPSGSGKTSLAVDTLYAEGQRRYVESLSAYARQFLLQMPKPKVERIEGLSPAICIERRNTGTTPRSTVGTVTEIYDYLRLLYARLGRPYCPKCLVPVESQTTDDVVSRLLALPEQTRLLLLSPVRLRTGQSYEDLWQLLREQGFVRVRVDGTTYRLENVPQLDRRRRHTVEVVVDRLTVRPSARSRLADSVETAFELGQGVVAVAYCDESVEEKRWRVERFSLHRSCPRCGQGFEELSPNRFSFNSPLGWCPACQGLGEEPGLELSALVGRPDRSLLDGAITFWPFPGESLDMRQTLEALHHHFGLPLDVPFSRLELWHRQLILYGSDQPVPLKDETGRVKQLCFAGLYPAVEETLMGYLGDREFNRMYLNLDPSLQSLLDAVGSKPCSVCCGSRLRLDAAHVRLKGKTLFHVCSLPLSEALAFFRHLRLDERERKIAGDLLQEVVSRLSFLVDVGLHYLTLDRPLPTLSGGETQRIQLASQLGRALTGVLYVLDEPTIGLHPRDNGRLLDTLRKLRDRGNTLVLVEHDRDFLKSADRLFDFGPGAGRHGGQVVSQGTPKQLKRQAKSLTAQYLAGRKSIPVPTKRRMPSGLPRDPKRLRQHVPPGGGWLEVLGAHLHNLRDVDARIPLGTLTCVTGVSGSGKSSLIAETLAPAVESCLTGSGEPAGPFRQLRGVEHLQKVIVVDQRPIGSTPRSNPGTYTGVFDAIRQLFAQLPDARMRGWGPGRFSLNVPGGRCEACEGNGQKCVQMHFLPDVWVECDQCRGRRFNAETLTVRYRGYSIADVLEMPIEKALQLFQDVPRIRRVLAVLDAIGLGYLTLGQPAHTLSGGEAQRVKLAAELARPSSGQTLYILDEPTTGLHFDDIDKLLQVLHGLVDRNNTVVVIEHNMDVIKTADWIIDLGPEGGDQGGWIVAEGTPEDVAEHARRVLERGHTANTTESAAQDGKPMRSYTGELLGEVLEQSARAAPSSLDWNKLRGDRRRSPSASQDQQPALAPWERDGRAWHLQHHVAASGRPCRWDRSALKAVVEAFERTGGPNVVVDWNKRSMVEVRAADKKSPPLLKALTSDEWLLTLRVQVPTEVGRVGDLRNRLAGLFNQPPEELPRHRRRNRLQVKRAAPGWNEVTLRVYSFEEIDKPSFWEFIEETCQACLRKLIAGQ